MTKEQADFFLDKIVALEIKIKEISALKERIEALEEQNGTIEAKKGGCQCNSSSLPESVH